MSDNWPLICYDVLVRDGVPHVCLGVKWLMGEPRHKHEWVSQDKADYAEINAFIDNWFENYALFEGSVP